MNHKTLLSALAGALLSLAGAVVQAAALPAVEVYKSPDCGCCEAWIKHMRQAGFTVNAHNVTDVPAARRLTGMPERYGSCHTATVGGYALEGHVPAADVKRLLAQKPAAAGLAVPGMVPGSPGMESPRPQPYETLLIGKDGHAAVYAEH